MFGHITRKMKKQVTELICLSIIDCQIENQTPQSYLGANS